MAAAMVAAGHAVVENANGEVKSVRLIETAAARARMIGPPSGGWMTPKFTRRVRSDVVGTSPSMHLLTARLV